MMHSHGSSAHLAQGGACLGDRRRAAPAQSRLAVRTLAAATRAVRQIPVAGAARQTRRRRSAAAAAAVAAAVAGRHRSPVATLLRRRRGSRSHGAGWTGAEVQEWKKRFLIKDKYVWGSSSLWKGSQRAIHLCNSQRRMSLAAHKPHDRAFSTNHTIVLLETHPGAWGSRRDAAAAQRRCRPAGRWAMVLFHSASSAQAAASSAARLRFSAHVCQNQLVTMSTFTAVFVPPPPCCCLASVPRLIPQSINDDTAAF